MYGQLPSIGKQDETNTAETAEPTAEIPLAKKCVGEEEQTEVTYAVETTSVGEFAKEEEGEGETTVETPVWKNVVMRSNRRKRRKKLLLWKLPLWRNLSGKNTHKEELQKKRPSVEECCNDEQQEEGTSAVETPSVSEQITQKEVLQWKLPLWRNLKMKK